MVTSHWCSAEAKVLNSNQETGFVAMTVGDPEVNGDSMVSQNFVPVVIYQSSKTLSSILMYLKSLKYIIIKKNNPI